MKKPFVIGLTGGIGSGKTLASDIMKECGAYILDTDVLSREITAPGTPGARAIAEAFPQTARPGGFSRRALKSVVFSEPDALEKLDAITHPLINAETEKRLSEQTGIVVLVVPLLFETGMEKLCDLTVTVSCPKRIRIKRVVMRDNISAGLARQIMSCQLTDAEREKRADAVLTNDGSIKEFRDEVKALYYQIAERAD